MRPNREHIVFTLEDNILTSGHFYSTVTLGQSLWSGLFEHRFGLSSTNAEHMSSEGILYHLAAHYELTVKSSMQMSLRPVNWKLLVRFLN